MSWINDEIQKLQETLSSRTKIDHFQKQKKQKTGFKYIKVQR